ncbi:hypothetical protein ACQ86F_36870 [Streptomyces venezuelae ATCC 10712]
MSDLLGEVVPTRFLVPDTDDAVEVGAAVLTQLTEPVSALVRGFILAFETVADAYDRTESGEPTEQILQALALEIARETE